MNNTANCTESTDARTNCLCEIDHRALEHRIFEGISTPVHGVLLITEQGDLLYANDHAKRLFKRFCHHSTAPHWVPGEILHISRSCIKMHQLFPTQYWLIDAKISIDCSTTMHVKSRCFKLDEDENTCVLLTVEDVCKLNQSIVIEEAKQYRLTPRQQDIWLLYRTNHSYVQIAAKLCITLSAVKKHMRNIRAKQLSAIEKVRGEPVGRPETNEGSPIGAENEAITAKMA